MATESYKEEIEKKSGKYKKEQEVIERELKKYAANCNQFLRVNQISAKDRAGFISAIVLALTNEKSTLYTLVECSVPNTELQKAFDDKLNNKAIKYLMESLEDIWENQDKIPKIKKEVLQEYYERIMTKTLLSPPEGHTKQFMYGDNILSSFIFSIFKNIVMKMKLHPKIDIMGTFYTVFLKYASGDTKDKGIVLTPKHITELFCDIAEHYLGKKLNEETKVLDICTGTGAFLISALARMDSNIDALTISEGNFFATIQESDFYAGTRVKSLISRFTEFGEEFISYENKFVLAFIATVINQEEFRFSYGRVGSDKIPTLEIKLPCLADEDGNFIKRQVTYIPYKEKNKKAENRETVTKEICLPDFQYMENYIKMLPYSQCIQTVEL